MIIKGESVMSKFERIIFFDTTLRDGEQSPGASMNVEEKERIAVKLDKLGVDVIEAGFPAASDGDFDAVRSISKIVKNAQVAGLARTTKEDIDRAWEAVKMAKNPRLHIFIATSDIHLEHKLKLTRKEALNQAVEAISYAKKLTDNIEFSAEDGSRSDKDYLCKVFESVIDAGATTVNLPDTVGYAVPDEFAKLIEYVKKNTVNIDKAILSVHCHNDLGLATANTLAAIQSGARQVEVTVNGIGERAGNTSLEEVAMAIATRKNCFDVSTNIETKGIMAISNLVKMITGIIVQPNKAIVGANAFAHEAGIHQDGMLKNPMTYEIMKPTDVGWNNNSLVLGKHSGRAALQNFLETMDYDLNKSDLNLVFKKFKKLADRKKLIDPVDIEAIVNENILRHPEYFSLEYLHVSSGTAIFPVASLEVKIGKQVVRDNHDGNGPIDAIINTIRKITKSQSKLLRFTVNALTEGTDAQGEVTVRLQEGDTVALGRGSDPDILVASGKAYIDGLNRLEFLKKNPKPKGTSLPDSANKNTKTA